MLNIVYVTRISGYIYVIGEISRLSDSELGFYTAFIKVLSENFSLSRNECASKILRILAKIEIACCHFSLF